jgi:anti-sigma regulatory factor (Ser/Thr protein kinase)
MRAMAPRDNDDGARTTGPSTSASTSIREFVASHKSAVGRMLRGVFEIRSLQEAEKLSSMLATHCPDPEKVAVGIWELLSNAVEHGNLEISFEEKTALLERGAFAAEVDRRLSLPQYAKRLVLVDFELTGSRIRLTVTDQGRGFDFAHFLNSDAPPERPNGRGIVIASRLCFDRLTYHGSGNQAEALIAL